MLLTITTEVLATLTTGKGGYTRKGLALLGVQWPPDKGWKKRLVGTTVEVSAIALMMEQEMIAWRKSRRAQGA